MDVLIFDALIFIAETFVNDAFIEEKFPGVTTVSVPVPNITWFSAVQDALNPIEVEFE